MKSPDRQFAAFMAKYSPDLKTWSGGLQAADGGLKPAAPRTSRMIIKSVAAARYFSKSHATRLIPRSARWMSCRMSFLA